MLRSIKWLTNKIFPGKKPVTKSLRRSGPRVMPRPAGQRRAITETVEFSAEVGGRIEDGGPGKNVLVRNKYIREDTGTHETLTIIDESILEADDETGIDPYNSGRFDRAKSWDSSRSRK